MNSDRTNKLYNYLVEIGAENRSEEVFTNDIYNPERREKLYNYLVGIGAENRPLEAFDNDLGFSQVDTPTNEGPDAILKAPKGGSAYEAFKRNMIPLSVEQKPQVATVLPKYEVEPKEEEAPQTLEQMMGELGGNINKLNKTIEGIENIPQTTMEAWDKMHPTDLGVMNNPISTGDEYIFQNIENGNVGPREYAYLKGKREQSIARMEAILNQAKEMKKADPEKYSHMEVRGDMYVPILTEEGRQLTLAIDMLEKNIKHYKNAVTKADKVNANKKNGFWKGLGEIDLVNIVSAGWANTLDALKASNIITKANNGGILTPEENLVLEMVKEQGALDDILNAQGGLTRGYKAGQGVAESLPFIAGMATTSGASGAIKEGIEKGLVTTATKSFRNFAQKAGSKLLGAGASAIATTPLQSGMWNNYANNTINEWKQYGELQNTAWGRLMDGAADAFTDVFTESLGGVLTKSAKYVLPDLGIKASIAKKFGIHDAFLKDMFDKVQWGSAIGEAGEEFLASFLAPIVRGESFKDMKEEWKDAFSKENIWVTLATTGAMSAGFGALRAIEMGSQVATYSNIKNNVANSLSKINDLELKQTVYDAMQLPTLKDTTEALAQINWRNYDKSDIGYAVEYVYNDLQKNVWNGVNLAEDANKAFSTAMVGIQAVARDGVIKTGEMNGEQVYLLGDILEGNDKTPIVVLHMDGRREQVPMSAVKEVGIASVDDVVAEMYSNTIAEAQQAKAVDQEAEDIQVARAAGVKPVQEQENVGFEEGQIVVVNGEEGEITALDPYTRTARVQVGGKNISVSFDEMQPSAMDEGLQMDEQTAEVEGAEATPNVEQNTSVEEAPVEHSSEQETPTPLQMPMTEEGEPNFKMAGTDRTAQYLTEELAPERIDGFVKVNMDAAQKALQKAEKKQPKSTVFSEYKNEIAQIAEEKKQAQEELAFWQEVNAKLTASQEAVVEETAPVAEAVAEEVAQPEAVEMTPEVAEQEVAPTEPAVAEEVSVEETTPAVEATEQVEVDDIPEVEAPVVEETRNRLNAEEAGIYGEGWENRADAKIFEALAKALGVRIELVDDIDNGLGNGKYFGNTILIRKNDRSKGLKFVAGHEILHRMKTLSPKAFEEFKGVVKETMGEEFDKKAKGLKWQYADLYTKGKVETLPADATIEEEVVADFVGGLADNRDSDALVQFVERNQEKRTMLQTLRNAFQHILNLFGKNSQRRMAKNIKAMDALMKLYNTSVQNVASGQATPNQGEALNALREVEMDFTPEEQEIVDKAKADGTYMLAPNGKRTNLTPKQWAQVRTKAFKKWFGDWELGNLLNRALEAWNNKESKGKVVFGLSNRARARFAEILGKDIKQLVITDDSIRHIKKEHSEREELRGQKNMTPEDIVIIPYLINNYDSIDPNPEYNDKMGNRATTIKKRINGVSVIATIEKGKDKEFLVSNFEFIRSDALDASNKTPELNVRNDSDITKVQNDIRKTKDLAKKTSKVVDVNGEPSVLYHGTPNIFTSFDKKMQGTSTDRGIWGNGFYFSESSDYADTYARRNGVQGQTLALYLNIKKPLFVSLKDGGNEGAMYFNALQQKYFTDEIYEDVYKVNENIARAQEAMTNEIIGEGYDGVIVEYSHPTIANEYIAFEPNQIKSATSNVGTFREDTQDIYYSLRDSAKSLVGMHNLSLDKLEKVIKMGGLANPSVAILDIDKSDHEDYGDYSLILTPNMVDAKLGRNAGTWAGDAWTPTYPPIVKRIAKSTDISRFFKDISKMPDAMSSRVRLDWDSFLEGRSAAAMAYWFLFDKGVAPELQYIPAKYPESLVEQVSTATNGSFSLWRLSPEQRAACVDAYIASKYNGNKEEYEGELQEKIARLQMFAESAPREIVRKKAAQDLADIKEYGFDYDKISDFIRDVERDNNNKGKVDVDSTIRTAQEYIEQNNLQEDFDTWKNDIQERYGVGEYIFNGYTNSGDRKWLPHTLENASKWMKQQGREGSVATFPSFGVFVATAIPRMTSLESIRKRKNLLGKDKQEFEDFKDKWEKVYFELGNKLQPDAKSFEDYGWWRLIEAVGTKNPQAHIKQQYGIELSEEDVNKLNELIDAIRTNYPARYFETKFERPLQLNDFTAAVVPSTIPADVEKALRSAYLDVYKYDKEVEGSRREATLEATDKDYIRFSLRDNAPFYSNAEFAVNNIKQEKATPEQWLKMIEKNGGLKAGEDKWLGLSDWLKESKAKTLTKQEVLDYIRQNQIRIEEVEYHDFSSGVPTNFASVLREEMRAAAEYSVNYSQKDFSDREIYSEEDAWEETARALEENLDAEFGYGASEFFTLAEDYSVVETGSDREFTDFADLVWNGRYRSGRPLKSSVRAIDTTRLEYTTNGLTNKREIALVVPTIEPWKADDNIHFGDAGEGRAVAWVRFGDAEAPVRDANYIRLQEIYDRLAELEMKVGSSEGITMEEYEERARLREERDNIPESGNERILVIDEIQSNRHQEGREKGYRTSDIDKYLKDNNVEVKETGEFYEFYKNGELDKRFSRGLLHYDINKAKNLYVGGYQKSDIPDAPFDKNWHEVAMKRILRYAAENGYDKVAWTTGDQQAERYDISKTVDSIMSEDNDVEEASDGTPIVKNITIYAGGSVYNLFVGADGVVRGSQFNGKTLADIVGKPLADKLMEKGDFELEGDGLRIGGEGMRAFYDQILPNFMNKYGKKWGVKVGEVTMPDLAENNTMHSVDITPAMRESVMQGQPLFSLRGYTDNFKALAEEYNALDKNDAEALADFRARKRNLVEEYWNAMTDELGLSCGFIVIDSSIGAEAFFQMYNTYKASADARGETPIKFNEFVEEWNNNEDGLAAYMLGTDTAFTDIAKVDKYNTLKAFTRALLHENVHQIIDRYISPRELSRLWREVALSKIGRFVRKHYKEEGAAGLANEYLAYTITGVENNSNMPLLDFIRGKNNVSLDDLLSSYGKTLPLRDKYATIILKTLRYGYNEKEKSRNSELNGGPAIIGSEKEISQMDEGEGNLGQLQYNVRERGNNGGRGSVLEFDETPLYSLRTSPEQKLIDENNVITKRLENAQEVELARRMGKKEQGTVRTIEKKVFNRLADVEKMQEALYEMGVDKSDANNFIARFEVVRNVVDYKNRKEQEKVIVPMLNIVSAINEKYGFAYTDISDYLAAKHSIEREDVSSIQTMSTDANALWNRSECERIVAEFEGKVSKEEVDELWNCVRAITQNTLSILQAGGVYTKEQIKDIQSHNWQFYVPLQGWDIDAEGLVDPSLLYEAVSRGTSSNGKWQEHSAEGRSTKPQDPLSTIAFKMYKAIYVAEYNKAMNALYYLVSDAVNTLGRDKTDFMFKASEVLYRKTEDGYEEADIESITQEELDFNNELEAKIKKLRKARREVGDKLPEDRRKAINEEIVELEKQRTLVTRSTDTAIPKEVIVPRHIDQARRVYFYVNGRRMYVQFANPKYSQAINGETIIKRTDIDNTIAKYTRFLSQSFTTFNPEFSFITNSIRDFRDAFITHLLDAENGNIGGFINNYLFHWGRSQSAIYRAQRGDSNPLTAEELAEFNILNRADRKRAEKVYGKKRVDDTLFMWFAENGGITGYTQSSNIFTLGEKLKKDVAKMQNGDFSVHASAYRALADSAEIITRYATFLASLDKGQSVGQAVSNGRNVSVNFNRKGESSDKIGTYYSFFNASMQGIYKYFKLAQKYPARFGAVVVAQMALGYATSRLVDMLVSTLLPDNDDDELTTIDIPLWMRLGYTCIPVIREDGKMHVVRIPKAIAGASFSAVGVLLNELENGRVTRGEALSALGSQIASSWTYGFSEGAPIWRAAIPTAIQPLTDLITNMDAFGREIYRTDKYNRQIPDSELGNKNVIPFIYEATKALNAATGGSEYKSGAVDINPSVVQYILQSVSGGYGVLARKFAEFISPAFSDQVEFEAQNLPMLGRLAYTVEPKSWYNDYAEYEEKYGSARLSNANKEFDSGYITKDELVDIQKHNVIIKSQDKYINKLLDLRKQFDINTQGYNALSREINRQRGLMVKLMEEIDWSKDNIAEQARRVATKYDPNRKENLLKIRTEYAKEN